MSTVKKKIDIKRREIHNRKQKTVRTLSNVKLFKILHRQFAEPSINKLEALLKDAKNGRIKIPEHHQILSKNTKCPKNVR